MSYFGGFSKNVDAKISLHHQLPSWEANQIIMGLSILTLYINIINYSYLESLIKLNIHQIPIKIKMMLTNLANIISRSYSGSTNQVQRRLFWIAHYSSLFEIKIHKSTNKIRFQSKFVSSYLSFSLTSFASVKFIEYYNKGNRKDNEIIFKVIFYLIIWQLK